MSRWIFTAVFMMLGLSGVAQADPAIQAPSPEAWERLIASSGVGQVLEQTNDLIEQEISNLEKAPLGFSALQLETMRNQLRQMLGSERLKHLRFITMVCDPVHRYESWFYHMQRHW